MEPVPETERMEEFRPTPTPAPAPVSASASSSLSASPSLSPGYPSLRLQNPSAFSNLSIELPRKPPNLRRSTDPSPTSPASPSWSATPFIPYRPRTTSPLSGAHSRSRSTTSLAPPMSRTQSMPGVNGSGHILFSPQHRPGSPSGSPSRVRIPRKPADEAFPPISPVRTSVLEPEQMHERRSTSPIMGVSTSTPARLRRPSSPLRAFTSSSTGSLGTFPSTPSSSISSTSSYRSYDALSGSYGTTYSSVPSTPTSTRSRSPSISSLETIPDTPDAEEAALEAERIAQLKADADAAEGNESSDLKGKDGQTRGRTMGFGSRDKRKRWSVCGAERRGDLDLETIWED